MSRAQAILLWSSAALLLVSGLVYASMRYLMRGDDPFSAYNHPAQPWMLDVHVLLAPFLLFAVGWFWGNHVAPKLRSGVRSGRATGIFLLTLVGAMTLSGYGLQTLASDAWRTATAWTHGVTGVLFFGVLAGHLFDRRDAGGVPEAGAGRAARQARLSPDPTARSGSAVGLRRPARQRRRDPAARSGRADSIAAGPS